MSNEREQRVAETFVALSDTLVDDFDVLDFLSLLAERSAELLDVSAAGVILSDQRGGWQPTATSSEDPRLLDVFTVQTRQGPCRECTQRGEPVASSDLAADADRWPVFAEAALAGGFYAAYAVPMRLRRSVIGSLTLLNAEPVDVDEASTKLGQALADQATIGLLHQRSVNRPDVLSEQLQAALHHRTVVEQAKGVLAEHGGVSMQQAFELLRGYARATGQGLSVLARDLANRTVDPADLLTHHTHTGLQRQN